ncbi:uncharacterized protein LOC106643762 [Copidosoma floridanum]|uniref:uncharacterized protein LOC106643762 n=1 Tax=Copidosoma floridanum TaxID=29053 RepID=UPI0006C9CBAB|nr:uncharacterized protein LOC106643762 [Copidosoma floridanum]
MSCSVNECSNPIWFKFPKDQLMRNKWLQAIKRPDFLPKSYNGLCIEHFRRTDLTDASCFDNSAQRIRLRQGVVPSVFSWSKNSNFVNNETNSEFHSFGDLLEKGSLPSDSGKGKANKHDHSAKETVETKFDKNIKRKPRFNIEELKDEPTVILEFTGLECYSKFKLVFDSLGEEVNHVNYGSNRSNGGLSKENQLFLTLWKLKKNCTNRELGMYFNISKEAVGNIFKSWINFMACQWSTIIFWLSEQLVQYYMPENFEKDFPLTNVIINGTEIDVKRQSTFSYYNDTTVKTVLGSTPGGLLCYCSDFYEGSTSDRQVVQQQCEPGDVITADRGFSVQDIFAPYNITVATSHFTKGKGYLPLKVLLRNRKLSRYRAHIERIIDMQSKLLKV